MLLLDSIRSSWEFYPLQPGQREIVGQELRTNNQFTMSRELGSRESRFEDYIVKKLIDFDDIDYFTQADLLYDLASQAVANYQAQSYSENELHEIFDSYGAELARLIRAEMMAHFGKRQRITKCMSAVALPS